MKIYDIEIHNFRGIHKLTQLKCGDINTIVGKNDSGKSTIIRALDAFFNRKFTKDDIFAGKDKDELTEIIIRFEPSISLPSLALDIEGKLNIKKQFYFDKANRIKVDTFYTCNDIDHPRIGNLFGVKEDVLNSFLSDELKVAVKKSGRTITNISKIEEIEALTQSLPRVSKTHPADEFLKNLEDKFNDFELPDFSLFDAEYNLDINDTDFQKQFKPLITESLEKEDNKKLTESIEGAVSADLTNEFSNITRFMQKNVPDIEIIQPKITCNWNNLVKFDIELKFKNEKYNIPIGNKGTGFKRLLMVAYFEYIASKASKRNQIFSIEEPETYLHPSLQNDLLNSIIKISKSSQFFITTHSPVFGGATKESNIVIVKKEDSISKYYNHANEDDIIKSVIQELGIQPNYNLLKSAKFLIFVEGMGDIHFLENYANTVLGKNLTSDGIISVIGGGSSLKNYADLDLFHKLSNGQRDKYAVFVDGDNGDASKQKEKLKIKSRCESDGAMFIQLSKRDIENYCHPDRIKDCYVNEIYLREGVRSQNPRIAQISALQLSFNSDSLDIENYLNQNGLLNFKDGIHIKVMQSMTSAEWTQMDNSGEIKKFIQGVYAKI